MRRQAAAGLALAVLLCTLATLWPATAFAAGNVYSAQAVPSYANPVTGEIEDAAGTSNTALGESMVSGATVSTALLERNPAGGWLVTLRFKLQDQISAMGFEVSGDGQSYQVVGADIMQTDDAEHTADYRFALSSELDVVRCTMDVVPMGRAVTFFVTLTNFVEGAPEGFVVSVADETAAQSADGVEPPSTGDEAAPQAAAIAQEEVAEDAAATDAAVSDEPAPVAAGDASSASDAALPETGTGPREFNADGVEVTGGTTADEPLDAVTIALVIAILVAAAALVGGTVYAVYVRPKSQRARAAAAAAAPAPDANRKEQG